MLTACGGSGGVFVEAPTASFATTTDVPRPSENVFVANLLSDNNQVFIHLVEVILDLISSICVR